MIRWPRFADSVPASSGWSAPVFSTARARTKSAATVMGAAFENPASASSRT
ncbi:MAG: hypothetical protein U5R14_10685 [Gemmatimonadota bacterium]|nr:hypothetical protein [Gemmatimonadota bacterium]